MSAGNGKKIVITNSAITCFRTCARKYYWRYLRELELKEKAESLTLGAQIHKYLEGFYLQTPIDPCDEILSPKGLGIMEGLAQAYPQVYADDFNLFEVLAVEKKIDGPIVNPESGRASLDYVFGGKIDALVQMKADHYGFTAGDLVLLEHKSASRVDENYLDRLELDSQIRLYSLYLERQLKLPIAGVLYNIVIKPAIRSKKEESPAEFSRRLSQVMMQPSQYQRHSLRIPAHQLFETEREIWCMKALIARARREGLYPRNDHSCFDYSRKCDYYELCISQDPEQAIVELGTFQHIQANAELAEATVEPF